MAAAVFGAADLPRSEVFLESLRLRLGREAHHLLSWKNIKTHAQRLEAAAGLATASEWLTISAVVVCKPFLDIGGIRDADAAYLYTLRFLLERLSWIARDREAILRYTLAHVVRFRLAQLRDYEQRLARIPTKIHWPALDPRGGMIDQPKRIQQLQIGDLAASAIFRAFEPDQYGRPEPRYLQELAPALYRHPPGQAHFVRPQDAPVEWRDKSNLPMGH